MRKLLCASVVLALAIVVAGCGGSATQSGTGGSNGKSSKPYPEFRLGELMWGGDLIFKNFGWQQTGHLESLVVQHLVEIGPNGQPKLVLASSVEHPNQTTYIYSLRKGVRFSDGKPMTVADVVYSLDFNRSKYVVNAKEPWEVVASVAPRGDSAVVVKLKRPNPDWPNIMAMASGVIEKADAEKVGEAALGTQHGLVIGTGPWKYDSYTPEASVQLSRNPYWTGSPQPFERINVTVFKSEATMALALRSGAIDAAASYESQKLFVNIPGDHQLSGSQNWITWVSMKTTTPPFNDVHVRRAVAYATNVNGIVKTLYPEGGATSDPTIIPTPLFAGVGSSSQVNEMLATLPKYELDLAKAKQELAKSAYPHGFTTTVAACVAEPILLYIAQILAGELAKLNITAKVKGLQSTECTQSFQTKSMFINEFISFVPNEPDLLMSALLSPANAYPSGAGSNWPLYKNAEVAKLLPEVINDVNPATRLRLAGKTLAIAASEEPYVPLFMHSTFMALSNKFTSPALSFYTTVYAPWLMNVKLAKPAE